MACALGFCGNTVFTSTIPLPVGDAAACSNIRLPAYSCEKEQRARTAVLLCMGDRVQRPLPARHSSRACAAPGAVASTADEQRERADLQVTGSVVNESAVNGSAVNESAVNGSAVNGSAVSSNLDVGSTGNATSSKEENGSTNGSAAESLQAAAVVAEEQANENGAANAQEVVADEPGEEKPEAEEAPEKFSLYQPSLELKAAVKVIPHPDKVEKGGEDAFLISDVGAGVICVADGVGGWADDGVDPALYSKEFVGHLEEALEAAEDVEELEPRGLLRRAHAATASPGAATAVVAVLDGERSVLQVANLGDSGLRVVRKGEIVFKTTALSHFFDCPFQFGSESSDSADDATVSEFPVEEGDTLVMASDGFFDNVFENDLASVINVFGGEEKACVQRTATALAALAAKHSQDADYMSPYVLESIDNGYDLSVWDKMMGKKLSGGKPDDITVIVAQVVKASESSSPAVEEPATLNVE